MSDPLRVAALLASSAAAGVMNAMAGGGTILTYPTLVLLGESPITANATSTVALWPGSAASLYGFRRDVRDRREWIGRLFLPSLLGGALCLDFANTTSGLGSDHCLEHLCRYEHLLLWSRHVGSITEAQARRLRHAAGRTPAAAARTLLRAKELRRAIYAICTSTGRGRRPPAPALAVLNREIATAAGQRQLAASDQRFAW